MPAVTEMRHPRGLNFANERKVVMLRTQKPPLAFKKIATLVRNLQNKPSTEDTCRRVFSRFSFQKGRSQYKYASCGRKPYKITPTIGKFIIRKLRELRRTTVCTSSTVQSLVYTEYKLHVTAAGIRKHLISNGYHWVPRAQKRQYTGPQRKVRRAFAGRYRSKSLKGIHETICMAMDGVVLTVPPSDATDRKNFCMHGVTHMWRKRTEAALPELAGDDPHGNQVPLARAIPLWGAISAKGFREIAYHKRKKLSKEDWVKVLNSGSLSRAMQALRSSSGRKPWSILCDNESFLSCKPCEILYKKKHMRLLHIPARSPDFNPIESFWGWLRQHLRLLDLSDLRKGRKPLGKSAYRLRVKSVLKSAKAQAVAKAKFNNFKKVCQEVWAKKGAASRT